jgi:O-antigen/teichoic acid export membrane protein
MGEFEYGIYVLVWTWVLVLSGNRDLGMPTAIMRLLPEYLQRAGCCSGARAAAVLAGMLVAAVAPILLWLGERLNSHFLVPIYPAIACVPLCALSNVQDGIGRGRGWMAAGG